MNKYKNYSVPNSISIDYAANYHNQYYCEITCRVNKCKGIHCVECLFSSVNESIFSEYYNLKIREEKLKRILK